MALIQQWREPKKDGPTSSWILEEWAQVEANVLVWVSPKADPDIRILVQVIYLEQSKDVANEGKVANKISYHCGWRVYFFLWDSGKWHKTERI